MSIEIIALAGRIASGKSKAAELLAAEFDAEHIEYSSFIYRAMDLFDIEHTRQNIEKMSYLLRHALAPDILCRAVLKRLRETRKRWVVLSTIRRAADLDGIKEQYPVHLWYVDADQHTRYRRHVSSARNVGDVDMTFTEFQEIENNEVQRTIPLLKGNAEVIIENNSDYEMFLNLIRSHASNLIKASES